MTDVIADLTEFHERFGIGTNDTPRTLPPEFKWRAAFLREELDEYNAALRSGDLEGQLDALVDLVYVAVGNALIQGFDFAEAWRRVHAANMQKVKAAADGVDSKRGSAHDVVKPPGWTPPDLSDLVRTEV